MCWITVGIISLALGIFGLTLAGIVITNRKEERRMEDLHALAARFFPVFHTKKRPLLEER